MCSARFGGRRLPTMCRLHLLPDRSLPVNILVVSAQKPDSTGSGVYLAETVRGFEALGHRVAVVCGVDASDEPFVSPACALYPVRFNTPELPFDVVGMSDVMPYPATRYRDLTPEMTARFKAAFAATVENALDQMRAAGWAPDLVLCHHLYLVTAVVVQTVAEKAVRWCAADLDCPSRPIPVAALCHNTDLRQMRSHGLERMFIVDGACRLDAVLALHDAQVDDIVQVYGVDPARVRVVGTGYNDAVFFPDAGVRRDHCAAVCGAENGAAGCAGEGRPDGPVRAVYAGKIARAKGVESLLRCLPLASLDIPAFELHLAGGYSSADEYARARELAEEACGSTGGGVVATFEGKLPQSRLARLYNRSDVFVLPSFCEGLPLVVVEALACGCKVVVTDLPGIRPWIEAQMPGAPVVFVAPPRMVSSDEPLPADLPAFEERLARALAKAAALPTPACARARALTAHLSWGALAARILEACA